MEDLKKALKDIEYFLLDMDGTIYLGDELIGEMDKTLDILRAAGKKMVYLTNNSSRGESDYREKLKRMNLWRDGDSVYTSGMATANLLKTDYAGKRVNLLGTNALKSEFVANGIELVDENADICVLAYDTELEYKKLCRFTDDLNRGAYYMATHPDVNCPAQGYFVPDAGAFMAMIEASTKRLPQTVVGKPFPVMGKTLTKKYAADKKEFIMVGDRLHTDIRFGNNCGFYTLLVLSGESTVSDLKNSDASPTFILDSLNEIVEFL